MSFPRHGAHTLLSRYTPVFLHPGHPRLLNHIYLSTLPPSLDGLFASHHAFGYATHQRPVDGYDRFLTLIALAGVGSSLGQMEVEGRRKKGFDAASLFSQRPLDTYAAQRSPAG